MAYAVDDLLKLAEEAVAKQDFALAINYCEQIIALDPNNLAVINNLSLLYLKKGELDKAQEKLLFSLSLNANNAVSHNNLGLIYFQRQQYEMAAESFAKALALKKDYISAMYNLALCYEKQNRFPDAVACLLTLIEVNPSFAQAYFLLGKICLLQSNAVEAKKHFDRIIELFPDETVILQNIVKILLEFNQYKLAKPYCLSLINSQPDNLELNYNLGVIAEKENEIEQAILFYEKALALNPEHFPSLNNLGVIYLSQHQIDLAKQCFERACRIQPENESIQHTLNALRGDKNSLAAPQTYISQLFDAYADHFDEHLQISLDYRVPELLYEACQPFLPNSSLTILDLGCGTGLTSTLFKQNAKKLVGVDLSKKMLEEAKKKNIFNELYQNDIEQFLKESQERFDLILAGDVLVYVGKLSNLFSLVSAALNKNGLFVFSIEKSEKENFLLQPSARFSHSKNYIHALTEENNLIVKVEKETATRSQFNQPVSGLIYVLQKL